MSDRNKAVVQRWTEEIWHRGAFSSAKELLGDNLQVRSNQIPPFTGVKLLQETVPGLRAGFPDGRFTVDELVAEGDTVVHRWTFRGTHRGEWLGVPGTGNQVEITGTATGSLQERKDRRARGRPGRLADDAAAGCGEELNPSGALARSHHPLAGERVLSLRRSGAGRLLQPPSGAE